MVVKSYDNTLDELGSSETVSGSYKNRVQEPLLKRLFDIVLSTGGLVVSSPLWLFVALAIYIEDGGPIFFTQDRLGRFGKLFKVIKFRSMIKDAENQTGPVWAHKKDHRVTKVGRFLRLTALDELPQLINILKGDMSFVGPRAERPELVNEFKKTIKGFDNRLLVRPGLTGIAQVYGNYNTHPRNKLRYDMLYINNMSFWLDLKLVLASFWITFKFSWESREKRIDKLLGQVILEAGIIDAEQLSDALSYQNKWGGKIGEILINKGYITESKLTHYLNMQVSMNANAVWNGHTSNSETEHLLGDIMLATGVVTTDQLSEALDIQSTSHGKLGQILRDLGYISEARLIDCLKKQISMRNPDTNHLDDTKDRAV